MNKRMGLTLVEVIVAIGLLGLIALVGLQMMAFSYRYLLESRKYTHDTFTVQQNVEQMMQVARSTHVDAVDPSTLQSVTLFGKEVVAHKIDTEIPATASTAHGEIHALVPYYGFTYSVPVVNSVAMTVKDGATDVTGQSYYYPLDSSVAMTGSHTMGDQSHFLLNVYRWYMSPVMVDQPTSKDWIIIKEWNEARTPLDYAHSEDFTFIPNIKDNYDSLDFHRDFGFSDDEIGIRYGGRYFCYSVTPYSEIGRVGTEVFSNKFSTNKIMAINPIVVYLEYSDFSESLYHIDINKVSAQMLSGPNKDVNVNWATNTIDYDQPEIGQTITYTVNGTVTGYQDADGVDAQFQLIVTNEYADPVLARIAIMGDARIEVPTGNQITRTYTATLIDTNGNPMTGPTITWSLAGSVPGVSINSGSGELTVTNAAGNKNCEVVASAGGVNQHYSVKIAKVDPAHSSVSIVIERDPGSSRNWITTYSLVACDDLGTGITNLTETDIYVNRVYDNSSTYKN